ncbi:CatA-like O-acetyltransferase [Secundilactobacillus muriivasis]
MTFHQINRTQWTREPYFNHFLAQNTSFNMTADIDITDYHALLRQTGEKLYPALIYAMTTVTDQLPQMRTTFNADHQLGYWETLTPLYTVIDPATHLFSGLWTPMTATRQQFNTAYLADTQRYIGRGQLFPQGTPPENLLNISMIPWTSFSGFNLQIGSETPYLLPIITVGKIKLVSGREQLPVSLQVHHAVCDGYDAAQFFKRLQAAVNVLQ